MRPVWASFSGDVNTQLSSPMYEQRQRTKHRQEVGGRLSVRAASFANRHSLNSAPQWGAADAEIKVPSGENTGLKRSPFKAWIRSVYSHACYASCQGFLPCLFLHFQSIYLHFSKTSPNFLVLAVANTWFLCRPAELNRSPCRIQVPVLSSRGI